MAWTSVDVMFSRLLGATGFEHPIISKQQTLSADAGDAPSDAVVLADALLRLRAIDPQAFAVLASIIQNGIILSEGKNTILY